MSNPNNNNQNDHNIPWPVWTIVTIATAILTAIVPLLLQNFFPKQDSQSKNKIENSSASTVPSKTCQTRVEKYSDDSHYEGQLCDGKREGKGDLLLSNGDQYLGQWSDDKFDGIGSYIWANGDRYHGDWKNGKRNGKGVFKGFDGLEKKASGKTMNLFLKFANAKYMEEQIAVMANDPDIKLEIAAIHQEFIVTEMDGLEEQ